MTEIPATFEKGTSYLCPDSGKASTALLRSMGGTPISITCAKARESCYRGTMIEPGKLRIEDILGTVASYYGVECEALPSAHRNKTLVRARHVAMYLTRTLTQHSLPEIARSFNRDHTVVLHAFRKIETLLQSDEVLKADIDLLSAQLSTRVQLRHVA